MPIVTRGFLRPSQRVLGANIKAFREKVILYTKLKKNINTFKNVTMARYIKAQERTKNRDTSVGVTAKLFSMPELDVPVKPSTKLLSLNITTNRGTCGALNSRQAQNLQQIITAGYNVRAITVGRKGTDSFAALLPENLVSSVIIETEHAPTTSNVIANLIFEAEDWDVCRVSFTRWVSVARQDWAYVAIPSFERFSATVKGSASMPEVAKGTTNNARLLNALIGMDEEILRAFWEFHVQTTINFAVEENSLSELAARIVAVENQLQNISKLRDWAQTMYNKTRQASVTAELLELTSAAAAMEGIDLEEAQGKARRGSKQTMTHDDRSKWVSQIEKAVIDLRFRVALAESSKEHAMPAEELDTVRARINRFVEWRALVSADETNPPAGTSVEQLRRFLSELPQKWSAEVFASKMDELRRNAPETIGGSVVSALAAK
eukprot:TRINITY_DN33642_c0_g1_i1.p2 TRINITY_DN33642_c0_g1~~TRINITY_DN33642_c0_g1_i1.p2  ORF type:complete len:436 (-),score=132.89 TRINITY_DN33642_c0_g1_i1:333-1640(-)